MVAEQGKRVERPDCMVEKTVFESVACVPETLQSPSRQQQAEETG